MSEEYRKALLDVLYEISSLLVGRERSSVGLMRTLKALNRFH
jgi:hypothetical protein